MKKYKILVIKLALIDEKRYVLKVKQFDKN